MSAREFLVRATHPADWRDALAALALAGLVVLIMVAVVGQR